MELDQILFSSIAEEATQPIIASCDYYSTPWQRRHGSAAVAIFLTLLAIPNILSWFPVNQFARGAFPITRKLVKDTKVNDHVCF
jgi:hypothetical protein